MKIAMVGSGYVGLVSGACFADFGHDVVCIDKDPDKIAALNAGIMPIYEPGLAELVGNNARAGRLAFTTDLASGIEGAAAIFIAVGTPSRRGDGHADLSFVYAVAHELAAHIKTPVVIVTKSTVPVGTGDAVERIIADASPPARFAVASNPEFLREGAAIGDFKRPDRIVIGTDDSWARQVMNEVYRPLFLNKAPILFTSRRSSELIKYASNAFLATKITFINEVADLCEAVGANVQDVAHGVGMDKRIGGKFLHAGPGYGGSCFPKDTLALLKTAEDCGSPIRIVEAVVKVNESRKRAMGRKVIESLARHLGQPAHAMRGRRVALLGLTFKPNTDDMRDAPSIAIAQTLLDAGIAVMAYDPEGMDVARPLMPEVTMAGSPYEAAEGADAVVIATEWDAFRALDLARIRDLVRTPIFVDLRNVYSSEDVRAHGFEYTSIGRESNRM